MHQVVFPLAATLLAANAYGQACPASLYEKSDASRRSLIGVQIISKELPTAGGPNHLLAPVDDGEAGAVWNFRKPIGSDAHWIRCSYQGSQVEVTKRVDPDASACWKMRIGSDKPDSELVIAGCASLTGNCPLVASVKTMPMKETAGVDASYDKLVYDDRCEPTLMQALYDLTKMRDPRQAPFDSRFVVSDAAVFILLRRRNLNLESILPADVAGRLEERGVYAYFDYVETTAGRQFVIARVHELVGKQAARSELQDPAATMTDQQHAEQDQQEGQAKQQ
jgi:hypothetical protein